MFTRNTVFFRSLLIAVVPLGWGCKDKETANSKTPEDTTSCVADLTLTLPDGTSTTLDYCQDYTMEATFEFDPDSAPEIRAPTLIFHATTDTDFECWLKIVEPAACGEGYYRLDGSSGYATLDTTDCEGVSDDYENEYAASEGYLRMDTIDAGEEVGSFSGTAIETTMAGHVSVTTSNGISIAGEFSLKQEVTGTDAEGAACVVSDGDEDDDGYIDNYYDGDDCDDSDSTLNLDDVDGDGYTTCDRDCDDTDATLANIANDADCDGALLDTDCDDTDSSLNLDDADGDGYTTCDGDCDDSDNSLNLDDADGDGYSTCDNDCDDTDDTLNLDDADDDDYSTCALDCDDTDSNLNPGSPDSPLADYDCDDVIGGGDLTYSEYSFVGENSYDYAGFTVNNAGDVDGDGLDDMLVGAYGNGTGGIAYLILGASLGSTSRISLANADYSFVVDDSSNYAGWALSGAGDVDGDGLDDILIGALGDDEGGTDSGKAFLVFGASLDGDDTDDTADTADTDDTDDTDDSDDGDTGSSDTGSFDTGAPEDNGIETTVFNLSNADYIFVGENSGDNAGRAVSSAGDVDGDGLDDILIGASGNDDAGTDAGKAYLFLGSALGSMSKISLALADHSFVGEGDEDYAGWSLAGAGDVDKDGHDDILVGAYGNNDGGWDAGKAYLILGGSLADTDEIALADADYSFTGEESTDYLGRSLSGAGDVDGDGRDDMVFGAYGNDDGGTLSGKAYLVLGSSLGSTTAIDISDADYTFVGDNTRDYSGWSASGAGDVDGDGLDDILVGAIQNADGGTDAGKGYLILGASLGSSSEIALADADHVFVGQSDDDYAAYSMSSAGDVNGDGLDDVLVGAPLFGGTNTDSGKAYLILSGL